jgi:hypothetical protein
MDSYETIEVKAFSLDISQIESEQWAGIAQVATNFLSLHPHCSFTLHRTRFVVADLHAGLLFLNVCLLYNTRYVPPLK